MPTYYLTPNGSWIEVKNDWIKSQDLGPTPWPPPNLGGGGSIGLRYPGWRLLSQPYPGLFSFCPSGAQQYAALRAGTMNTWQYRDAPSRAGWNYLSGGLLKTHACCSQYTTGGAPGGGDGGLNVGGGPGGGEPPPPCDDSPRREIMANTTLTTVIRKSPSNAIAVRMSWPRSKLLIATINDPIRISLAAILAFIRFSVVDVTSWNEPRGRWDVNWEEGCPRQTALVGVICQVDGRFSW